MAGGSLTAERVGVAGFGVSRARRDLLWKLWEDKFTSLASLILLVVVFFAIAAPVVVPFDPTEQNLAHRLTPPLWERAGSLTHPLGTDYLGRDLLSRIIAAARISLFIGVITVAITAVIGTTLGLVAGFLRGKVDELVMLLTDVIMGFPGILLLLAVAAMMGPSLSTIVVALSVRFWTTFARVGRGLTLSIRESDYVTAARVVGCSNPRIVLVHVLPNMLSPILTLTILECGRIMLAEAGVSFLGFGIQSPLLSWGLMMAEGRNYLSSAWWTVTFPGLALFITILAMIAVQSFLRVATDPLQQPRAFARNAGP